VKAAVRTVGTILLVLGGTEIGLRLAGAMFYALDRVDQHRSASQAVILCVGESSTYGLWTGPGESYPEQLERLLNDCSASVGYRVLQNEGIGSNTAIVLERLPELLRRHRPAAVIFMVGANNFWSLERTHVALFAGEDHVGRAVLATLSVLDRFRVFKLTRMIKQRLAPAGREPWPPTAERNAFYGRHWSLFHEILLNDLRRMIHLARAHGTVPLLMTYATGTVRDEHLEVAGQLSVPLIDNTPEFQALKERGIVKDYLFDDGWHPNQQGYAIVARNAFRVLNEQGVVACDR
jgi:lysophospholipase L1-like esterase